MILELEKEVNNEFAKPALLPNENQRFEGYTVSGFGKISPYMDSDILRTVELSDIGSTGTCGHMDLENIFVVKIQITLLLDHAAETVEVSYHAIL